LTGDPTHGCGLPFPSTDNSTLELPKPCILNCGNCCRFSRPRGCLATPLPLIAARSIASAWAVASSVAVLSTANLFIALEQAEIGSQARVPVPGAAPFSEPFFVYTR